MPPWGAALGHVAPPGARRPVNPQQAGACRGFLASSWVRPLQVEKSDSGLCCSLLQKCCRLQNFCAPRWGLETLQYEGRGEESCLKAACYIVYVGFLEGG